LKKNPKERGNIKKSVVMDSTEGNQFTNKTTETNIQIIFLVRRHKVYDLRKAIGWSLCNPPPQKNEYDTSDVH